jgi:hypothetical protein
VKEGAPALVDRIISPRLLFACGAAVLPALLFQPDLVVRIIQVSVLTFLCLLMGRKTRIPAMIMIAAGVVVSNLILPTGRVLWSVFGFPITEAALKNSLVKATAVAGMISLSKLCIRTDLPLPGRIGGLLGRCLMYFELIMSKRARIRREAFFESIDEVLQAAYDGPGRVNHRPRPNRTTPAGFAAAAVFIILNWGALAVSLSYPVLIWHR